MSHTSNWCLDRNKIKTFDKQVFRVNRFGGKYWYLNGKLHKENGPAIEHADGHKYWYLNGQRHRENGPAIEHADGCKWWYLNGYPYSESDYWEELQE